MPATGRGRSMVLPSSTPGCIRSLFDRTIRSVPSASTTLMRWTVISPKFCGPAGWPNAAERDDQQGAGADDDVCTQNPQLVAYPSVHRCAPFDLATNS
jgi:hypothetical protein